MRNVFSYIALVIVGAVLVFAAASVLRPVVQDILAKPTALLVSPK
jgi:hypothetical protein